MLVVIRRFRLQPNISESGLTWSRHVYYRSSLYAHLKTWLRNSSDFVKVSKLNDSSEIGRKRKSRNDLISDVPTKGKKPVRSRKEHPSLASKVVEKFQRRTQRNVRVLTDEELREEEKFAKFLSTQTTNNTVVTSDETDNEFTPDKLDFTESSKMRNINRIRADWSEQFGTLTAEDDDGSEPSYYKEVEADTAEEELFRHVPLGRWNRKHEPDWYARKIMKLGRQGHIAEAISVFEDWMINRDRVKPTKFEYGVLISAVGRVGYTKKAFSLFNEMVRKGYPISNQVYTSLFHSCLKAPWPELGLEKAEALRRRMLIKKIQPHYITYLAMIEAFAICGDVRTAMEAADEAIHFYRADARLLDALLLACQYEPKSGFRHAILIWRMFKRAGIKFHLNNYKRLLVCAQVAGVDDNMEHFLQQLHSQDSRSLELKTFKGQVVLNPGKTEEGTIDLVNDVDHIPYANIGEGILQSGSEEVDSSSNQDSADAADVESDTNCYSFSTGAPTVLDPNVDFSPAVSLNKTAFARQKFAYLGNMGGFLELLDADNIEPDVELFSLLMTCVSVEEVDSLLDEMLRRNITPNVEFCNKYLYALASGNKEKSLWDVIEVMKELNIKPNMKTYSNMARGCRTLHMGKSFLKAMENLHVMPDLKVMQNLFHASGLRYSYKIFILKKMTRLDIRPNVEFMELVEKQIKRGRQNLTKTDDKTEEEKEAYSTSFDEFLTFYDDWIETTDVQETEHPWKNFQLKNRQSN